MNAHDIMMQFDSINIFELKTINGVRYIKIHGFFYPTDQDWDEEKYWRDVEFSGYEMPLDEFLSGTDEDREVWECSCKQYIGDVTPEEALERFREYKAVPLSYYSEITDDTPDGFYY